MDKISYKATGNDQLKHQLEMKHQYAYETHFYFSLLQLLNLMLQYFLSLIQSQMRKYCRIKHKLQ